MPDMACGTYLLLKSLPEGGWMRYAGLTFRRRTCRREDGYGLRGLPSAEELAGERMDTAGGTYLPPKNLPERGWMRQAGLTFRRRACRGRRMEAAGGIYLPPKNLPRREANDETAELPLSPSPCKTRFNSFS